MTQAPTPGPLMVGDYAVRLEDHPLVKSGEVHRVTEMFRGGYLGFARPVGGEWNPSGWRKCDADGWMPWAGGENPVPGQRVEVRLRDGSSASPDEGNWVHDPRPGTLDDIIAFRLAPTAPVEASGSELWPVGSWLSAALDDPKVCDDMKADIRQWFDAGGHFRPQPTREADEASGSERERLAKCIHRAIGYAWIGEHQAEVAADAVLALQLQLNREQK